MRTPVRFCAVSTKNRLAHARVLTDSILRYHPHARVDILLVDPPADFDPSAERFRTMRLSDLAIPDVEHLAFKYTGQQFCGLLKAWTMRRLLEEGAGHAVYFDATCLVTGRLEEITRQLARHEILISPHLTSPLPDDGKHKNDHDILCSGTYNSGFVAVTDGPSSRAFLDWWIERTREHCMPERGSRANDQKWLALVPALFSRVGILRAPGHHLAYWNVHDRAFRRARGGWLVNDEPCRFFQFSGFEPDSPREATRYQNERVLLTRRPDLREFFDVYRRLLLSHGYEVDARRSYAFDAFSDGTPISGLLRRLYREVPRPERFGDPFDADRRGSFYRWLSAPVRDRGDARRALPRLWAIVHRDSEVLRRHFPKPFGRDRAAYLSWAVTQGARALGIPKKLVPTIF